ncbi:rhodanese-like domain-containing protein [uncultured Paracoccus sp.]|uniref:rhodanese-like domain-containing protein n=1 Tax=uncultured Paracoccus sp. TaxID=189685 RepID=UPI00262118DF|nr:rhodanese-like domain-containing protein [uncultured Paracoccus sp.]
MCALTTRLVTAMLAAGAFGFPAAAQDSQTTSGDTQAVSGAAAQAPGQAPRVSITADMPEAVFTTDRGKFTVSRNQTPGAKLEGDWALVGHDCPPFCIQPMQPAPGVTTIGELELIEMMQTGDVILVDGRTPDWYEGGTIPGSINIPYTQAIERLAELNCTPDFEGKFDCTDAAEVILFCNGQWCGQSPSAIRAMLNAGYPADRINYYRGGMLDWRLLGLTVQGGEQPAPADPIAQQDVSPAELGEPGAAQEKAAADGLPQNAGQEVDDGVMTPAENPVVETTAEDAADTSLAPEEGEATAAQPDEGAVPAASAVESNAENADIEEPAADTTASSPEAEAAGDQGSADDAGEGDSSTD